MTTITATRPVADTSFVGRLRDKIAHALFNLAYKVATPWYGQMIVGSVHYGLNAAARDVEEGIPSPGPWQLAKSTKAQVN